MSWYNCIVRKVRRPDGGREVWLFGVRAFKYAPRGELVKVHGMGNEIVRVPDQMRIQVFGHANRIVFPERLSGRFKGQILMGSRDHEVSGCVVEIGEGSSANGCRIVVMENDTRVVIGRDCMISWDVEILASDTHSIFRNGKLANKSVGVWIGDHVWIGAHAVVLKNSRIGAGSIVGCGAIVASSEMTPENVVLAGNPARVVSQDITWNRQNPDEQAKGGDRMRLTVATAVLNARVNGSFDALERCVRSVARLGDGYEHVIYDGGSLDGTYERLVELAHDIPTLRVYSEPDGGIYDALNKCLSRAQGRYFYVLGADDWLLDPERMRMCIDRAYGADLDLLMARVELDDGSVSPQRHNGIFCCHQGLLMTAAALRSQGGFDTTYRIAADYKCVLRAHADLLRMGMADDIIAHFSGSGVSCRRQGDRRDEFLRAKAEVFGLTEDERKGILAGGAIPMAAGRRLLCSSSASTRKLGREILFGRLIYRKVRTANFSRRYVFGVPLPKHLRSAGGGR